MRALLMIDIQNDFMPFGSLPVPHGEAVVPIANALAPRFDVVIATQDWHPASHSSFASNHAGRLPGDVIELAGRQQVLWPDHCVQQTAGASLHSGLDVARIDVLVRKGVDVDIDSYSGFFDNGHLRDTGMRAELERRGVDEIWLVGLATDYCVKYTALDGAELGLHVVVVGDGVRAVDLASGDGAAALAEMRQAGCEVVTSAEALV